MFCTQSLQQRVICCTKWQHKWTLVLLLFEFWSKISKMSQYHQNKISTGLFFLKIVRNFVILHYKPHLGVCKQISWIIIVSNKEEKAHYFSEPKTHNWKYKYVLSPICLSYTLNTHFNSFCHIVLRLWNSISLEVREINTGICISIYLQANNMKKWISSRNLFLFL